MDSLAPKPVQIGRPDAGLPGVPGHLLLHGLQQVIAKLVGLDEEKVGLVGIARGGNWMRIPRAKKAKGDREKNRCSRLQMGVHDLGHG
jgi:hypothetical protein